MDVLLERAQGLESTAAERAELLRKNALAAAELRRLRHDLANAAMVVMLYRELYPAEAA